MSDRRIFDRGDPPRREDKRIAFITGSRTASEAKMDDLKRVGLLMQVLGYDAWFCQSSSSYVGPDSNIDKLHKRYPELGESSMMVAEISDNCPQVLLDLVYADEELSIPHIIYLVSMTQCEVGSSVRYADGKINKFVADQMKRLIKEGRATRIDYPNIKSAIRGIVRYEEDLTTSMQKAANKARGETSP
jgi:hypothetical protein